MFAFLMTSARSQLDDPCRYASMPAHGRRGARDRIAERVGPRPASCCGSTEDRTAAQTHTNDLEAYIAALDELCARTARFLVGRFGEATDG